MLRLGSGSDWVSLRPTLSALSMRCRKKSVSEGSLESRVPKSPAEEPPALPPVALSPSTQCLSSLSSVSSEPLSWLRPLRSLFPPDAGFTPPRSLSLHDRELSLSGSRSLATTAPLHQGSSRFELSFLSEISKIHFPQMGRSFACAAACAPHSGLAALIPRLTAHHISLMVSLMIQLLFLKSHPSALHPPPRRGPRPWDPQPAGRRRAPEPARRAGRRDVPGGPRGTWRSP